MNWSLESSLSFCVCLSFQTSYGPNFCWLKLLSSSIQVFCVCDIYTHTHTHIDTTLEVFIIQFVCLDIPMCMLFYAFSSHSLFPIRLTICFSLCSVWLQISANRCQCVWACEQVSKMSIVEKDGRARFRVYDDSCSFDIHYMQRWREEFCRHLVNCMSCSLSHSLCVCVCVCMWHFNSCQLLFGFSLSLAVCQLPLTFHSFTCRCVRRHRRYDFIAPKWSEPTERKWERKPLTCAYICKVTKSTTCHRSGPGVVMVLVVRVGSLSLSLSLFVDQMQTATNETLIESRFLDLSAALVSLVVLRFKRSPHIKHK